MKVNIGMGNLKIKKVGNASPEHTEINTGIAKIEVDLGEKWRNKGKYQSHQH